MINDHSIGTLDQVIHFAAMILHKVLRYQTNQRTTSTEVEL